MTPTSYLVVADNTASENAFFVSSSAQKWRVDSSDATVSLVYREAQQSWVTVVIRGCCGINKCFTQHHAPENENVFMMAVDVDFEDISLAFHGKNKEDGYDIYVEVVPRKKNLKVKVDSTTEVTYREDMFHPSVVTISF